MAADGSIVIQTDLDDKKAQAELNRLAKKINDLNAKIKQAQDARLPLLEQAEALGVQLDVAKAKLAEMQAVTAGTYSKDQIADQTETVKSLQAQWDAVQKQVERYDRAIDKSTAELKTAETRAGELAGQLADAGKAGAATGEQTAEGFNIANSAIGRLEKRLVGLAKRVFVFSVITSALRGMRSWLSKAVKSNDEAAAAIARLKGALLTLAQPILNAVIPAFTWLANILSTVIGYIASFVSILTGSTVTETAEMAENLEAEKKGISGVGGAAKKAAKQLAGFDEIQKLTNEDSGGGGSTSGAITPLFDAIKNFEMPDWLEDFATGFKLSVNDVLFDWTDLTGEQIAEKAIAGLTALAGGVAGFAIGGVPGAILGSLAGLVLGLVIDTLLFDHDGKLSDEEILKMILVAIGALVGGVLGFKLTHSAKGAAIGVMIGAAVMAGLSSMIFDNDGVVSSGEIWKMIRMALFALAGGVLGFFIGGPGGALLGVGIGVGVNLLLEAIDFTGEKARQASYDDSPIGQLMKAAVEEAQANLEAAVDLSAKIDSITGKVDEQTVADFSAAQQLIDEIFEIDAEENKTAEQIEQIKLKIDTLNSMNLDGVSGMFQNTTEGYIIPTRDAVDAVMNSLLQQYRLEALHDAYVEQFKNQYAAEQQVKEITDDLVNSTNKYRDAQTALSDGTSELNQHLKNGWSDADALKQMIQDYGEQVGFTKKEIDAYIYAIDQGVPVTVVFLDYINKAEKAISDMETAARDNVEALQTAQGNYEKAKEKVGDLEQAYIDLATSISKNTDTAKDGGEALLEGTAKGIEEGTQSAQDAMDKANQAIAYTFDTFNDIHSPSGLYEEKGDLMMEGLANGITNNAYKPENALKAVCNNLLTLAQRAINNMVSAFNSTARSINASSLDTGITIPTVSAANIPLLAQGAVIPPNREFLAVLGDQKRGTNIEAPLDTIVAAFRQAMGEQGGGRNQTIVLQLDRRELGRAVVDASRLENQRVGVRLGGAY